MTYSISLRHLRSSSVFLPYLSVNKIVNADQSKFLYSTSVKDGGTNYFKPDWIQFSRSRIGSFFQETPKLHNTFLSDFPLQRFLIHTVPAEVNHEIVKDLSSFGQRIVDEIDELGRRCELQLPTLMPQDAWGNRVDELTTCNAWKQQHKISAEEGLIAIGYERKLNEWSRLHQVCKLYLYSPSAGMYTCPLAMTDGAAKTIEVVGDSKPLFKTAFDHLTSRDHIKFWTSGQWMTERRGGSDVANGTETVAVQDNEFHRLYGYKWFTSATDSNMALTLAREIENSEDYLNKKGLTLFYLETRNQEGYLNNIEVMRLKNKLGTRQVPTAELLLDGCVAYKMSEGGHGVSAISNMLNITRLYNAIGAVGGMRRIVMLARDYSQRRNAFGKAIGQYPLHMQVLSRMEMETRGALILLLKAAILLGKAEVNIATADETQLLRLILPLLKLYTAKQAVSVISEGLEAFGGQGYIEDTGLPVMLRDAQVLPIWEGTTNIMSLDVLRCFSKSKFDVLKSLQQSVHSCLELGKQTTDMSNSCSKVENSLKYILNFVQDFPQLLPVACRDLSYSLARTYIGALLIENASLTKNSSDISTAQRWCENQELCLLSQFHENSSYTKGLSEDTEVVMEGYKA